MRFFVLDLKWVTWEPMGHGGSGDEGATTLKVISASGAD